MTSIFVGLPYTRPDVRAFTKSLAKFTSSTRLDVVVEDVYGLPVDEARNDLVDRCKEYKTDYLAFIDNDAAWAVGAIDRLVSHDKPVICGGMYTRTVPPRPTIGRYMGKDPTGRVRYHYHSYVVDIIEYCQTRGITSVDDNAVMFDEPDVREYDAFGMHFAIIRRDVLEAIKPPLFIMQGKTGAGEDFYFCQKAREAGFKLYTDLSVQSAHYAGEEDSFGIRDLLKVNNMVIAGGNDESELVVG